MTGEVGLEGLDHLRAELEVGNRGKNYLTLKSKQS